MLLPFKVLEKSGKSQTFPLSVWFSCMLGIELEKGICFCPGHGLTSDQGFLTLLGAEGDPCPIVGACYFVGSFRMTISPED